MKQCVNRVEWTEQMGDRYPATDTVLQNMPPALRPLLAPTFAAIRTQAGAVTALWWEAPSTPLPAVDPALLAQVRAWLADYFTGYFRPIPFPLVWRGTLFQHRLGAQLAAIPPGQRVCYGALAQRMASSPRAIGRGVGRNPLPLLLPCHRVVAANGLGGFSAPGGIHTKQWLLSWEQLHTQTSQTSQTNRTGY